MILPLSSIETYLQDAEPDAEICLSAATVRALVDVAKAALRAVAPCMAAENDAYLTAALAPYLAMERA